MLQRDVKDAVMLNILLRLVIRRLQACTLASYSSEGGERPDHLPDVFSAFRLVFRPTEP